MTFPFAPSAHRPRTASPLTLWRAAALAGALGAGTVACKNSEEAKAPEAQASGEAAPTGAPSAAAPSAEAAANPTTAPAASATSAAASAPSVYSFEVKRLDGTPTSLAAWQGKVLLIVNTASKCGYTPQYQGLQQLHAKYSASGFEVLGFPSNDFGGQEPGTAEEISNFCITMYDVNFPMFEKTKTTGPERSPLYALLSEAYGEPKWNFHKYLIDKHGKPVQAWPSKVAPGAPEVVSAIEAQLAL